MKNNFRCRLLALTLSLALMLNSSAVAFATDEGADGASIVTQSETIATSEGAPSADGTAVPPTGEETPPTNEPALPAEDAATEGGNQDASSDPEGSDSTLHVEGANRSACTCDPAPGASGVEGHGKDCPQYVAPAIAVNYVLALIDALPSMDELIAVNTEGAEFTAYLAQLRLETAAARTAYDALTAEEKATFDADAIAKLTELEKVLATMPALMTTGAITIKVNNGEPISGTSLENAIGSTATDTITDLTITAGAMTAVDWTWFDYNPSGFGPRKFSNLINFTIAEGVTVASIPDTKYISIFPTTLESVDIPQAISIGEDAFKNCNLLTTVNIPAATAIGQTAFYKCTFLKEANFPKVLTTGVSSFEGCTQLEKIDFPMLTTIGTKSFFNCDGLTTVELLAAGSVGESAFYDCGLLEKVSVHNATIIGDYAFSGCPVLATVELPAVKTIGENAFQECVLLKTVSFPSLEEIGIRGFWQCDALATASFPKVKSIGGSAFSACISLAKLKLPAVPPSAEAESFKDCPTTRTLVMVNGSGAPLTDADLTTAQELYKVAADGNTTDNLWYGWTIGAVAADKITITVTDGTTTKTDIGGTSLSDAVTRSALTASAITKLTITKGEVTTADWAWFTGSGTHALSALTDFTVTDAPAITTVANIPSVSSTSRAFPLSIVNVSIPQIAEIGSYAFNGCAKLTAVSFPKLTSISNNVFKDCAQLASADIPSATTIGNNAFSNCTSLKSVTFNKVSGPYGSIGSYAFYGCTALETVTISNVTVIYAYAFEGCTALKAASFPEVIELGPSVFFGCTSLKSVSLPLVTGIQSGTQSGKGIFEGCTSLETAYIPLATTIGNKAFKGCAALTSVTIPSAKKIGNNAFEGCKALTSASFLWATEIGSKAFEGCEKLETLNFPLVETIASEAFKNCKALTSASFPVVTTIGANSVFGGCVTLAELKLGATPPSASLYSFDGCPTTRSLTLVNKSGVALTGTDLTTAQELYKAVNDRDTTDDLWYGWKIGGAVTGHTCNSITFDKSVPTSGQTFPAGNYYLNGDVTASANLLVDYNTTVNLCLNGHTLTTSNPNDGGGAYSSMTLRGDGSKLNIYDCSAASSGKIIGGSATNGGCISNNGTLSMHGGTITDNSAIYYGGGVRNSRNFTLYGKASITGNTNSGNGSANNLFVDSGAPVMVGGKLYGTIGVTPSQLPSNNGEFPIAKAADGYTITADDLKCFVSDVAGYELVIKKGYDNKDYITMQKATSPGTVTGVTLNKSTLSLEAGKSETLTATVAPATATNKAITWQTSNTSIATVDTSGKVTAVKAGTATITVTTTDGGKTATCAVTVTEVTTKPAPGGKLEAPLTQDKVNDVFGEGNATLNDKTTPPTIKLENDITPEKPIEIIASPVKIDLGDNTITGKPGEPPLIVGDNTTTDITGGGTVSGGDSTTGTGGNGITGGTGSDITIGDGVTVEGGDGTTGGDGINSGGNVTVDGDVNGGNGSSGNGGAGVDTSGGTGDVTIKPGGSANGGSSTGGSGNGGDGTSSGGDTIIGGDVTGGNGSGNGSGGNGADSSVGDINIDQGGSAAGGTGNGSGNGGDGAQSGGSGSIDNSGTVSGGAGGSGSGTGGNGGNGATTDSGSIDNSGTVSGGAGGNGSQSGGNGGNGTTTDSGDTTVSVGGSTSGGSGGSGTSGSGGAGGSGSESTGGGNIDVGGGSTGGAGGSGSTAGGNGGNGTATGGDINVADGGSSTGGNGGSSSTGGGNGGNGTNTSGGATTVDGGATGGNGGNGNGNGSGGNGGAGASQGGGTVNGGGAAAGGNGGNGAGTGNGGTGGAGVGGGAAAGSGLTTTGGVNGLKATTNVDDSKSGTTVTVPDKSTLANAALTADEKKDKTITEISVTLSIEKKDNQPDKAEVEKVLSSELADTIGAFFDITLDKIITNAGGAQPSTKVTDTSEKIKITITIPTSMRGGSNYVVIRVHNGVGDALTTSQAGDDLTFSTDKFSTYAIAYTKSTTPPLTDNTVGGGSDNGEYDFWMTVKDKIDSANNSDVIKVNAKSGDKLPSSVMEALRKHPDVTLVISWNGGNTITIPSGKAQKNEQGRVYYPLSLLAELYQGIAFVEAPSNVGNINPETGGGYIEYADGKQTPVTGDTAQLDAPTIANAPDAPAFVTPPTAGFEADAFAGTEDAKQASSGNVFAVIALMLAAVAVGSGVWFWKRGTQTEKQ